MVTLYHRWSSMPAQRVRLSLACKRVPHREVALAWNEAELFFALGAAAAPLLLVLDDGTVHADSVWILERLDDWFGGEPILRGVLEAEDWHALLDWRARLEPLLARLVAPALPAFRDVGGEEGALAEYKGEVQRRWGMSVEALSGDRYDGYRQFAAEAGLKELARRLAKERFYASGRLSAADIVLACDLFPLQLLDGVTLPIDLLYYIDRIEKACGASPREGLVAQG